MRHLYHGISRVDDGVKSPPLVKVKEEEHILDFLFTKSPKNELKNFRIRSPSPKLYKKSLKPIGPGEINDFLKYDKEKNLAFISLESKTRDISHIKDKISFPPIDLKSTQNILPTDIKHLQKLVGNEEPFGCSSPSSPTFLVPSFPCMKEECNEFRLKTQGSRRILRKSSCAIPELSDHEKIDLGNPTGRQDVENLKKWLQIMIDKTIGPNKNIEDVSKSLQKEVLLIYTICIKEIIRQVSVHCIERGEILKEVVEALMKIKFLKINRLKEKFRIFEEKWKKEVDGEIELKMKLKEDYEERIAELNEIVTRKSNSKLRLKAKLNSAMKQSELLKKQTLDELELNRRKTFYGFRSLTPVSNKSLGGSNSKLKRSSFRASSVGGPALEEEIRGAMYDFENGIVSPISNKPDISDLQIQVSQDPSPEKKTSQNSLLSPNLPQEINQNVEASTQWDLRDLDQSNCIQGFESPKGEKTKVNFITENEQKSIENLEIIEENEEAEFDINEEEEKFLQIGLTEEDLMDENSGIQELSEFNIEEKPLPDLHSSEKIIKLQVSEEYEEKNKSFSQISHSDYKNPDESSPNNGEDSLSKNIQEKQSKLNFITFLIKKKMIILKNLNKEIAEKKENMQYSSEDQISMVLPNEENESELQSFFEQSKDNITSSDLSSDSASESEQDSDYSENSEDSELNNDTLEEDKADGLVENNQQSDIKQEMTTHSKSSKDSETLTPIKTGENKIVKYRKKKRKKTIINESKAKVREKHYIQLETNETETPKSGKAYDISPVHINDPIMIEDNGEIEHVNPSENNYTPITNSQINALGIPLRRISKRGNTMFLNSPLKPIEDEEKIINLQKTNTERHIPDIQKANTEMQLLRQDTKVSRSSNPKQGYQRRKERKLTSTKFKTFHFQKKETIVSKKIAHPAIALLAWFLNKKMEWVRKKSTMTRRMVHRLISSIYSSCLTKLMSGQILDGLLELTYDEFTQRYGNKKSSEKKFIEFISSLFSTIDSKRAVNFMRFIGTAKRISMQNYSKYSFIFYLQAYHSIIISNKGILVAYDDTIEKAMIPKIRATEFLNTKLEHIIDKQTHSRISATIEYLSVPDPKKINISGLVETEAVLELFIEAHEDYQKRINQGLYLLVEATRYNEDKTHLPFEEFLIYARTISPQKYYLARDDIRKWIENFKDDEEISQLEEIFGKCVEKNLLCIGDVHNFYTPKEDLSTEAVLNEMNSGKETMMDIIEKMKEVHEKKWISIDEEEWIRKIENCLVSVMVRNPAEAMLAWKIYKAELLRIYEIIDSN